MNTSKRSTEGAGLTFELVILALQVGFVIGLISAQKSH